MNPARQSERLAVLESHRRSYTFRCAECGVRSRADLRGTTPIYCDRWMAVLFQADLHHARHDPECCVSLLVERRAATNSRRHRKGFQMPAADRESLEAALLGWTSRWCR